MPAKFDETYQNHSGKAFRRAAFKKVSFEETREVIKKLVPDESAGILGSKQEITKKKTKRNLE